MSPNRINWRALPKLVPAVLIGVSTSSCSSPCKCNSPAETLPPAAPTPTTLKANIQELQVAPAAGLNPTRAFQLYAWYRDAANNIISGRFDPMKWSWTPSSANTADNGSVTVSDFPSTGSADGVIRAEDQQNASIIGQVPVTLWASTAAATLFNGGSDVVEAPHAMSAVPEVVVLEQNNSGVCSWSNKAIAFVGAAAVGEQTQPCSVAVLSGTQAMHFQVPGGGSAWGGAKATIPISAGNPLSLKLAVFIAVTSRSPSVLSGVKLTATNQLILDVAQAAEAQARADVDWANMIFEATRAGVTLDATYKTLSPVTDLPLKVGSDPFDCDVPRHLTDDLTTASWIDKNTISVYYVDWVDYPTDPLDPGSRGAQCYFWSTGVPGPVIYISYTRHSTTTLAHELGHALALEHGDLMGSENVMNSAAPDGPMGASARSHFTVGQVFRMNISDESWLNNKGPRSGLKRSCGIAGKCPPIEFDVR